MSAAGRGCVGGYTGSGTLLEPCSFRIKAPTTTDTECAPRDGAAVGGVSPRSISLGASHRGGKIFVEKLFGSGARHAARALRRLAERALLERARRREKKKGSARTRHRRALAAEGPWCSSPFCRSLPSRPPRFALDRSLLSFFFLHVRESNGRYIRVVYHTRSAGIRV